MYVRISWLFRVSTGRALGGFEAGEYSTGDGTTPAIGMLVAYPRAMLVVAIAAAFCWRSDWRQNPRRAGTATFWSARAIFNALKLSSGGWAAEVL